MATLPPDAHLSLPPPAGMMGVDHLPAIWSRIASQARDLARLARIGPDDAADMAIADLMDRALPPHRALLAQGIEDIAVMLDAGTAALATLTARGQDCAAPALALWLEYHAARTAIAGMLGQRAPN